MQTINPESFQDEELQEACRILQNGGLVAFPTETVYGLGGDALRPEASAKIYEAKGRPSDNPLIVHIADMESLEEVAQTVPEEAAKLAQHFWPGPLTMIFPKKEKNENRIYRKKQKNRASGSPFRAPPPLTRTVIFQVGNF